MKMKKVFFIGLALVVFVPILYSFMRAKIETPDYEVLRKIEAHIEIRKYPALILAQTQLDTNSYEAIGNTGFRRVASYIFGGNESNQKISMTAPVLMEMDQKSDMSFVMPKKYSLEQLPTPSNQSVKLLQKESRVLAVLRFGGYASDKKIQEKAAELKAVLQKEGLTHASKLIYMGYNAPWDFVFRRNEVAFELN
jgi:hypothetical protein